MDFGWFGVVLQFINTVEEINFNFNGKHAYDHFQANRTISDWSERIAINVLAFPHELNRRQ